MIEVPIAVISTMSLVAGLGLAAFIVLVWLLATSRIGTHRVYDPPRYRRTDLTQTQIDPDAPTARARRPKGRARVSTAHFSQRRSNW